MESKIQVGFRGFSPETPGFLKSLGENNNKQWFEANRGSYERYVLEPLKQLVADIGYFMLTIDPLFEITPAVDKTICRIYRDVRFSKDKSPYRSNMWITFKRCGKEWKGDPVYFFEIFPDWYRFGIGFYSASRDTMDNLRKNIDEKPREFLKAISFYSNGSDFILKGEKYKKIIDASKPPEIQDWYQLKNLYLTCNRKIDNRFFTRDMVDDLISGFKLTIPLYHYLWKVKV